MGGVNKCASSWSHRHKDAPLFGHFLLGGPLSRRCQALLPPAAKTQTRARRTRDGLRGPAKSARRAAGAPSAPAYGGRGRWPRARPPACRRDACGIKAAGRGGAQRCRGPGGVRERASHGLQERGSAESPGETTRRSRDERAQRLESADEMQTRSTGIPRVRDGATEEVAPRDSGGTREKRRQETWREAGRERPRLTDSGK